jgi:aspartate kinase
LQDYHFDVASQVTSGAALQRIETSLQRSFRDLRVILFEAADEGREVTPALLDEIASFGERMSSEIVAGALETGGVPSVHLDARQLILTDGHHTQATPVYWESYAKIRRVIPYLSEKSVVVMGGFIGATEDGVTTTLGRGGSDLTASIVGAGISAEEIQIWTDVDGMLTCDPRVHQGSYRLRSLSYQEAAALARAGAKVLHPDTVMPAVRQRIPLAIRNSRQPGVDGTRITCAAPPCSNPVKSIACKPDLMVWEIRPNTRYPEESLSALSQMCSRYGMPAEFVGQNDGTIFLALKSAADYQNLPIELDGCVEVRLHPRAAILTLVGEGVSGSPDVLARAMAALKQIPATIISGDRPGVALSLVVPGAALEQCVDLLHREFFHHLDPAVFAECEEAGFESPQPAPTFVRFDISEVAAATSFRRLSVINQN